MKKNFRAFDFGQKNGKHAVNKIFIISISVVICVIHIRLARLVLLKELILPKEQRIPMVRNIMFSFLYIKRSYSRWNVKYSKYTFTTRCDQNVALWEFRRGKENILNNLNTVLPSLTENKFWKQYKIINF